jgi:CubicO group peptidase (beta-lactamase class C family)
MKEAATGMRFHIMNRMLSFPGFCLAAWLIPAAANAESRPAVFPGAVWERHASPGDAGFSEEKLRAVREAAAQMDTAAVMIVRHGRVVDSWGEVTRRFNCHSIRKSFLSALFGPPAADGRIDLDATMADLGIDDHLTLDADEKSATVRMLLQARSGIYHPALYETEAMARQRPQRHSHAPGTHFYYNNWDFNALGTIYQKATGESVFEGLARGIAGPVGMEDFDVDRDCKWVSGPQSRHPAYVMHISARDLARFGLLFLNDGVWDGNRLLPAGWVAHSTRAHSNSGARLRNNGGYGYMWWVAVDGRHFQGVENIPEGTYTARGARGHLMAVVPSHDLVFVHRTNTFDRSKRTTYPEIGRLLRLTLDAVTDLPGRENP